MLSDFHEAYSFGTGVQCGQQMLRFGMLLDFPGFAMDRTPDIERPFHRNLRPSLLYLDNFIVI